MLGDRARPGVVVSTATSGDVLQWHPHAHVFSTDGAFSDEGAFHPAAEWDGQELMRLFRERLLARLVEKRAISEDLVATLMSWRHPGFSVHVGDPILPGDSKAIEDMAGYVIRNPLSLKRLVYLDGVVYVWKPRKGRNEMPNTSTRYLRGLTRGLSGGCPSVIFVSAVLLSGITHLAAQPAEGKPYR